MGVILTYNLNRVAQANWTAGDFLLSHAAVDLKIDPSQQFKISGIDYGYYLIDADQTAFLAGNLFGFLDFQNNPAESSLFYAALGAPNLGELIFEDQVTSVNDLWKHIDFNRPLVVDGNRRLTFIAGRPQFTAGPTGPGAISLMIRGEITQIEKQENRRLGSWEQR
jgi:hypothetical protein